MAGQFGNRIKAPWFYNHDYGHDDDLYLFQLSDETFG